jgi:hypothetical protein
MISYENTMTNGDEIKFAFSGLSTDTKPTGAYDGAKIANGSTFLEMDTLNLKFYDATTGTWI